MTTWQLVAVLSASFAVAALVVLTRAWHAPWTGDFENSGVQKHHHGAPPRIGALPLIAGLGLGLYFLSASVQEHAASATRHLALIILCSLPVVLLGLADDVTKKVRPRIRMIGAAVAGALAIWLLDSRIQSVDIPILDSLVSLAPVSIALTLLMVCGFTNAMNIIDGLNGLAGGITLLMLAATGYVAMQVGDALIVELCVVFALAVCGFLLVNFPRGLMFLGDGGAYLIGFMLVQIWLLLLSRNPSLTPWFVVAVAFHPTMETLFSIYRRSLRGVAGGAAVVADRLHMHSLVYRRKTLRLLTHWPWAERWVANASAAVLVVAFATVPMLLASLAPGRVDWNLFVIALAALTYVVCFSCLVRFRFLRRSARKPAEPAPGASWAAEGSPSDA